jgi:hypothetical protein
MSRREPPGESSHADDDYLLLFQRLLQRFSEHARALTALDARITEQAQAITRLDTLVTAQAEELWELREQSRIQAEHMAQIVAGLVQVLQAVETLRAAVALQHEPEPARPWWRRWWRA